MFLCKKEKILLSVLLVLFCTNNPFVAAIAINAVKIIDLIFMSFPLFFYS